MRHTSESLPGPWGAVLAGGRGARLGGDKARVPLAGRPLLYWPLAALTGALANVAVVAKADSRLPPLPDGVCRWDEPPAALQHPLSGIVEALRRAGGRSVLVCAVDLPRVDAALVRRLSRAEVGPGGVVIAAAAAEPDGAARLQPLLGRYEPSALAALERARPDEALTATVLGLRPAVIEVPAEVLLNVNDEADRLRAERAMSVDAAHRH